MEGGEPASGGGVVLGSAVGEGVGPGAGTGNGAGVGVGGGGDVGCGVGVGVGVGGGGGGVGAGVGDGVWLGWGFIVTGVGLDAQALPAKTMPPRAAQGMAKSNAPTSASPR